MNIQIYGTKKCFDTKKAQRYFKERNIKFQFIDLKEKGMSRGELRNIMQAVGSAEAVLNENCKDQEALALVRYIAEDEKEEKILAGSGRILVRPSGTELLIRVMVEAKEKAIADAAAEELSNLIKNKG